MMDHGEPSGCCRLAEAGRGTNGDSVQYAPRSPSAKGMRSAPGAWWGKSEASLASTDDRLGSVGHAQLGKDG